jgi:hypothetical protein
MADVLAAPESVAIGVPVDATPTVATAEVVPAIDKALAVFPNTIFSNSLVLRLER